MSYFKNILVSVDQLGNTLCGGNPDNTISARVGFFSQTSQSMTKYFWKGIEIIVNTTFWPIDGPNHCQQAFEADPEETFNDDNGDFFRFLLSFVIVFSCIPISIILYTVWAIKKIGNLEKSIPFQ